MQFQCTVEPVGLGPQEKHRLEACETCTFMGPSRSIASESLRAGPRNLSFNQMAQVTGVDVKD